MCDVFGIKGKALPWISDFLKSRVIRVKYNKTLSKEIKLSQGVPQGSVLSPTFFIFLAGVKKLITENSSIGLFADDSVLWHSSHDIPSIETNFSKCLSRLIDGIPLDAAKIYTDGSKGQTNTTGSGVLIELPGHVIKFQRRNADHASVFRTELIAIMCGLSFINNIRDLAFSEIWILTDSQSSIQHLSNWPSIGDSTSRSILHLVQQLSDRHLIHLQWVPSHVGFLGNEVADDLAKASTSNPVDSEDRIVLISTEIYSRAKELICRIWKRNVIFARHCLSTRNQQTEEAVSEYLQILNQLSKDCDFSDVKAEEYQKENIRDAFIRGLKCPRIRQRLLENISMTPDQAFEQARTLESYEVHAASYMGSSFPVQSAAMKTEDFSEETVATSAASSSSSRVIDKIIEDEGLALTYPFIDDVTVCEKDQKEHDDNLENFMTVAKKYNLTLNEDKCTYSRKKQFPLSRDAVLTFNSLKDDVANAALVTIEDDIPFRMETD
ncbi:uncharacterized protein TNCV_1776511 [Trichonephila clavipes]|nr:uncharacterized protein TNCV_1776511 [Trichonephila clavipes]